MEFLRTLGSFDILGIYMIESGQTLINFTA